MGWHNKERVDPFVPQLTAQSQEEHRGDEWRVSDESATGDGNEKALEHPWAGREFSERWRAFMKKVSGTRRARKGVDSGTL